MIPLIGLMIGLYIIARYCEMASKNVGLAVKIVLAILIIITAIIMFLLWQTSKDITSGLSAINLLNL